MLKGRFSLRPDPEGSRAFELLKGWDDLMLSCVHASHQDSERDAQAIETSSTSLGSLACHRSIMPSSSRMTMLALLVVTLPLAASFSAGAPLLRLPPPAARNSCCRSSHSIASGQIGECRDAWPYRSALVPLCCRALALFPCCGLEHLPLSIALERDMFFCSHQLPGAHSWI